MTYPIQPDNVVKRTGHERLTPPRLSYKAARRYHVPIQKEPVKYVHKARVMPPMFKYRPELWNRLTEHARINGVSLPVFMLDCCELVCDSIDRELRKGAE